MKLKNIYYKILKINPNYKKSFLFVKNIIDEDLKMLIDVGANKGDFGKAGRKIFPNIKVISFEPLKNVFNDNLSTFYNTALSNKEEARVFYISKINPAWSSLNIPRNKFSGFSTIDEFDKTLTTTSKFENLDISIINPCFLKIDTEGEELEVLEGFGEKLNKIDAIQLEWCFKRYFSNSSRDKLIKMLNLLFSYGFNEFIQTDIRFKDKEPVFCDFIFWRNKNEN